MRVKANELASDMAHMHLGNEMGTTKTGQRNCGQEHKHHQHGHWRRAMLQRMKQEAMMGQMHPFMNAAGPGVGYAQPMYQPMMHPMMAHMQGWGSYECTPHPMMFGPRMWHRMHKRKEEKSSQKKEKCGSKHVTFESCNEGSGDEMQHIQPECEDIPTEVLSAEDSDFLTSDAENSSEEKKHRGCKKGHGHHPRKPWKQFMRWKMMQAAIMNQASSVLAPQIPANWGLPMQKPMPLPMMGPVYAGVGYGFPPQHMMGPRMMNRMWKKIQQKSCEAKSDDETGASGDSSAEDKGESRDCKEQCEKQGRCGGCRGGSHHWRRAMRQRMGMQAAMMGHMGPEMFAPGAYDFQSPASMACPRMMRRIWKKMQKDNAPSDADTQDIFASSDEDTGKEGEESAQQSGSDDKKWKGGCQHGRHHRHGLRRKMMMRAALMGHMAPYMCGQGMRLGYGHNKKHMKEMWKQMKQQCKAKKENETDDLDGEAHCSEMKGMPWQCMGPHMYRRRCGKKQQCKDVSDTEATATESQPDMEEWEEVTGEQVPETSQSDGECKEAKRGRHMCHHRRRRMRMMRRAMMMHNTWMPPAGGFPSGYAMGAPFRPGCGQFRRPMMMTF